ncbi:hypothetical protein LEMLEM_LOCUS21237, partial [Lemmus lemmus]
THSPRAPAPAEAGWPRAVPVRHLGRGGRKRRARTAAARPWATVELAVTSWCSGRPAIPPWPVRTVSGVPRRAPPAPRHVAEAREWDSPAPSLRGRAGWPRRRAQALAASQRQLIVRPPIRCSFCWWRQEEETQSHASKTVKHVIGDLEALHRKIASRAAEHRGAALDPRASAGLTLGRAQLLSLEKKGR